MNNTFNNEYEYLIHLVKSAIHFTTPVEKPDNISFEKVFKIAKLHEIANISFVSIEKLLNKPDEELFNKWKIQFAFSIQRNANQIFVRNNIVNAFNNSGIRSIELQGTAIKKLYPYDFWRNMGDIDFIIDKQNLIKAEKIMQKLGYKTEICGDYDLLGIGTQTIEIHTNYFIPSSEFFENMSNPFQNAKLSEDGVSYIADDNELFLYNILHCIKHFRGDGMGIRRLIDIYYLNNTILNNLKKELIFNFLSAINCKQEYDDLSAIADEWFAIDGKKCELFDIKNKIYLSGMHGSFEVQLLNESDNKKSKLFYKVKKIVSLVFPSKKTMYTTYDFCAQHKLPIFICWIYRIFYFLFSNKKRKKALKNLEKIIKL